MGSWAKSSQDKSTQTQQTQTPWSPQAGQLEFGLNQARTAFGEASAAPRPDNFVAQLNPQQLGIFQKMMGVAGIDLPSSAYGSAEALTSTGTNAVTGGLYDLANFQQKGGTQYNIDAATQYANNPAVDGMIDAAMRDSRRQVSEQALPQIERAAAGTGNINASRRAISEGLVERGLAEKTADVSSNIRGQMFDQGLKLAQAEADASNNTALQAMLGRVSGGNASAGAGVNAGNSAVSQMQGLYDIAGKGVAGSLAGSQAGLNNDIAKYQFGTNAPFDALNNFWNIVASKDWGGTTTGTANTTQTNNPSTLDSIGRAVSTAGTIGSWFMSDRRSKMDVEKIGELYDGQPVYRFRYKNDPSRVHIGLMAQDVEKVRPEAVSIVYGTKVVNYDMATRDIHDAARSS